MFRFRISKDDWFGTELLASCFCCFIISTMIFYGLVSTFHYVKEGNLRISLTNTTCRLLKYNVQERVCGGGESWYKCFDEQFFVSYYILNGSYITSVSKSFASKELHPQREIGKNYICFYQGKDVTAVWMKFPNEKPLSIQLSIAFGIVGLCLFLLIIYLLNKLMWKINCPCSCFSKTSKRRNDIHSRTKMTKNIEQSTVIANLIQTGHWSEDDVI